MSCETKFTTGCPCYLSPEFISLAKNIGDLGASETLKCPLPEEKGGNTLPFVGTPSDFVKMPVSGFESEIALIGITLGVGMIFRGFK